MSDSEESEETLLRESFEEHLIQELVDTILERVGDGETEWQNEDWDLWVRESSGNNINAHVMYHCTTLWIRFKSALLKAQHPKNFSIKDVCYRIPAGNVKVTIAPQVTLGK